MNETNLLTDAAEKLNKPNNNKQNRERKMIDKQRRYFTGSEWAKLTPEEKKAAHWNEPVVPETMTPEEKAWINAELKQRREK
jgi:hypothetical protein